MNAVTDIIRKLDQGSEDHQEVNQVKKAFHSRLTGVVKWFDPEKGYGFIVPDNSKDGRDVLLHISCLEKYGQKMVQEGAKIDVDVVTKVDRIKGDQLQASLIHSIDSSTAVHKVRANSKNIHVAAIGGFEDATVKWFNRMRGFGFLTRGPGTDDIFVHMETLRQNNIVDVHQDQKVKVQSGQSEKGLVALDVALA